MSRSGHDTRVAVIFAGLVLFAVSSVVLTLDGGDAALSLASRAEGAAGVLFLALLDALRVRASLRRSVEVRP